MLLTWFKQWWLHLIYFPLWTTCFEVTTSPKSYLTLAMLHRPGGRLKIKMFYTSIWIFIIRIRRSFDCLVFIIEIPMHWIWFETGPCILWWYLWRRAFSYMVTSSDGSIFRVTGHLSGEFTGPRWIPRTKASDAELWCFLWSSSE